MDKRRAMMDEYRLYREAAIQTLLEQKELRLELRGGKMLSLFAFSFCFLKFVFLPGPLTLRTVSFRGGHGRAGQQRGGLGGRDHRVFYQRRNHSPRRSVVHSAGMVTAVDSFV